MTMAQPPKVQELAARAILFLIEARERARVVCKAYANSRNIVGHNTQHYLAKYV